MTAQVENTLFWRGKLYYPQSTVLFLPQDYGLQPHAISTACGVGYCYQLRLQQDGLFLTHLEIGLAPPHSLLSYEPSENPKAPTLPGYQPDTRDGIDYYHNIKLPLYFSGHCLLSDQAVQYNTDWHQQTTQAQYWMLVLNKGQFVELRTYKPQETERAFKEQRQDPTWQAHMWQDLSDMLLEPPAYLKQSGTEASQAADKHDSPFDKPSRQQ